MADLKPLSLFKEQTLPGTLVADSMYLVKPSGSNAVKAVVTNNDGTIVGSTIGFIHQGAYSPATNYEVGDAVLDQSSTWLCKVDTIGNDPPTLPTTSNTQWQLLAQAGEDGSDGTSGTGSGNVSVTGSFGTDNRLVRSDGTAQLVQASGITIDDSDNMSGVNNFTSGGIDDNASQEVIEFQNNSIKLTGSAGSFSVFQDVDTNFFTLSGGNAFNVGSNLQLFGGGHATQANDIQLRSSTSIRLAWDNSTSIWSFQSNTVGGVSTLVLNNLRALRTDVTNSLISISGSNSITTGGNVRLFGSAHATQANDIELRAGTAVELWWDNSAGTWDFNGSLLREVGNVSMGGTLINRAVDTGFLTVSSGLTGAGGANLLMYGVSHATLPGNWYLRDGATPVLTWEGNGLDFESHDIIQLGGGNVTIKSGTGSPESAVTSDPGSLWLRTDGTANNTLYIKQSGTGNTGWRRATTNAA